jgi:hypothetical protein
MAGGDGVKIPMSKWIWCGYPGHLMVADSCRFRLHTRIGNYRISTVGDRHKNGRRDEPAKEIGANCLFETYVFRVHDGEYACGEMDEGLEIDSESYNDGEKANEGHMAMCRKYARLP